MGFKNSAQPVAPPSSRVSALPHVRHSYNKIHFVLLLTYGKLVLDILYAACKACVRMRENKE
jgi:hypothetical protein